MRVEELKPPSPLVSSHSFVSAVSKSEQVSLSKAIIRKEVYNKFEKAQKNERAAKGDAARPNLRHTSGASAGCVADFATNADWLERHVIVRTDGVLILAR